MDLYDNVNMTINYIVKMPITNNVDLSNDYGSINFNYSVEFFFIIEIAQSASAHKKFFLYQLQ